MAIEPKRTAVVARELAPAGLRSGPKADNSICLMYSIHTTRCPYSKL